MMVSGVNFEDDAAAVRADSDELRKKWSNRDLRVEIRLEASMA